MPVRLDLYYTRKASRDLEDITGYLQGEAGETIAIRFRDAVDRTVDLLRTTPNIGVASRAGSPRHRDMRRLPLSHPFDRWMMFYTPASTEIRIDRVLHSAQGLPHFFR